MAHQFVREPLRAEEADRLANACRSAEEKLIVWTLLDTGLRVSELCSLTLDNVQWQQRALRVTGRPGPTARGANNGSCRCPHGSAPSWNLISP
jgi:integrase/recombinase XerD